jgi:intergrase/recombinase
LNPRRPSPEDLKSGALQQGVIDFHSVKPEFTTWLRIRGLNWHHYGKHMIIHLEKYSRPILKPMDLVECFSDLGMSPKRHLVNGFRNLFKYYETQGFADKQWLDLLRSNLPKTTVGIDLKIPTEKEIIDSLRQLAEKDHSRRYFALYNLLLDSGLRLTEAIALFNSLLSGEVELEKHEGFSIAPLGYFRGTKLAYYGFISDNTLKIIKEVQKPLSYKKVMGTATKRFGIISYKYLRKFAFDTMTSESLNIPESVADFIEGRTPKTVGARHYMSLKRKAIQFYPRYAEYVKTVKRGRGNLVLPEVAKPFSIKQDRFNMPF